jgi:hypothetical protein
MNQLTEYTPTGMPSEQELMVYQTWAKTAVDSNMYRGIGKESGIMMIMLTAREFGIGPAQAINGGINIIEGRVELSARMMNALIRKSKHSIKILKSTETECVLLGTRKDNNDSLECSFTIEEAKNAGLIKEKGAWKKTPKDMLYARALTRLARQLFADVIGIGYVEGEISQEDPIETPQITPVNMMQLEMIPEIKAIEENDLLEELLQHFDSKDKKLVLDFCSLVSNHYKWEAMQTYQEFLKDIDQTLAKFNAWKSKK